MKLSTVFYAHKSIFQIFTKKLFPVKKVYYVYYAHHWGSAHTKLGGVTNVRNLIHLRDGDTLYGRGLGLRHLHGRRRTVKYRKKPVVIEARQLTELATDDDAMELALWCGGSYNPDGDGDIYIETLEGTMHVSSGDWIIQGVQGEFYPCKPDIFAATYEVAE
jgi:hypothetical protein